MNSYITNDRLSVEEGADGSFYYRTSESISKVLAHDSEKRSDSEKAYILSIGNKLEWNTINTERITRKKSNAHRSIRQKSQVSHEGSPRVLVLLTQFADKKFKNPDPIAVFNEQMNGSGECIKEY